MLIFKGNCNFLGIFEEKGRIYTHFIRKYDTIKKQKYDTIK